MSFWIDEADHEGLELLAARNDRTPSAEVREAIRTRIVESARALQCDERRDEDAHPLDDGVGEALDLDAELPSAAEISVDREATALA